MEDRRPNGAYARVAWTWNRLRSMPPAEIPHRLRERWLRWLDRRGALARSLGTLPASLRDRPPPAWPIDRRRLADALTDEVKASLRTDVASLLAGRVHLLGVDFPGRSAWDVDPPSGTPWPRTFGVDFRRDERDPKLAWELHRLQHLQVLALGASLLGDDAARAACQDDLASWFDHVRPYDGLAWGAGIECAARVVSFLVVAGLLGADTLPAGLRGRLWDALHAHVAWIARYPSLFSSANNHRVAELGALVLVGALAPELPTPPFDEAVSELQSEAPRQILADGVGAEQSPTYQAYTSEWLLLASRACDRVGARLHVREPLIAGAGFLRTLLEGNGHPRIGDDDEGVVLRPAVAVDGYVASVVAATAAVLERPELAPERPVIDLRAALLGASPVRVAGPRPASRTFEEGGYTVLRDGDRVLVVDHGPLGMGGTAAHGHADALAVWLHVGDRAALADTGTYRYNGDPAWRAWARGAAAHNVLIVDGREPSVQTGPFNWGRRARARLVSADLAAGVVIAEHDGYAPIVVRRTVRLVPDGLVVEDELTGTGRHEVALHWYVGPGVEIDGSLPMQTVTGGPSPGPGWRSPGYNRLVEAPCVVQRGPVEAPAKIVTRVRITPGRATR